MIQCSRNSYRNGLTRRSWVTEDFSGVPALDGFDEDHIEVLAYSAGQTIPTVKDCEQFSGVLQD